MSESWDVYSIDRKKTGKTCVRGEQSKLSDDEFHLWVMVWIKNPTQTKWLTFDEIKEMYERGECSLNMGDLYGFESNPVPQNQYQSIRLTENTYDH